MKKRILALITALSMLLPVTAFADVSPNGAKKEISLNVNGKPVEMDQPPVIVNGRTLVPLRALAEALGCKVDWDNATRSASFTQGDVTAVVTVGESFILIGDGVYNQELPIDVPASIIGSRTMIPLRALSEGFGYAVDWDDDSMIVKVNSKDMDSDDTDDADEQESIEAEDNMVGKIEAYATVLEGTVGIIDAVDYESEVFDNIKEDIENIKCEVESMTYDRLIVTLKRLKEIDESLADIANDAGVSDIVAEYNKEVSNTLNEIMNK